VPDPAVFAPTGDQAARKAMIRYAAGKGWTADEGRSLIARIKTF
jgi:hypothetical protein